MKTNTLLVLSTIVILALGGCARKEFDRQIEICSVAEDNGLLEPAVEACGAALAIAEEHGYAPDLISGLVYRLGSLQRQRGKFKEAETLVRRSLALEEQAGEQGSVATRLFELSHSVAGQGRWLEGAELLERAAPLAVDLTGDERKAAANAFRGFSVWLARMGHTEQAERFKAMAQELAESSAPESETDENGGAASKQGGISVSPAWA